MISISFEPTVRGRGSEQPRQLHGDGRAALRDPAGARVRNARPRQCDRIEAGVKPEALVLDRDDPTLKLRIDFIEPRLKPPRAVTRRERHQPFAVVIEHNRRDFAHTLQGRREKLIHREQRQ